MRYLTFALAKGRTAEKAEVFFNKAGIPCPIDEKSRKFIFTNDEYKIKFILAKPGDVPTYVEYGAADLGVAGKDVFLEENRNLYEVLDLRFGKCRMAVAGYQKNYPLLQGGNNFRVATKYPNITDNFFRKEKNQKTEIIKMSGSVELAAVSGMADMIVDLVETGTTLKENGLVVFHEIARISARLAVNRASLKMEHERIIEIIKKLKGALDDPVILP